MVQLEQLWLKLQYALINSLESSLFFIPSLAIRSILKPNVMSWFSLSSHQSFVDCLNCFIFLLLGNKWNLKKFVPYSEMLESISQKWPNIERLSDHPNDTSKVFVQISLWYLSSMQNISPFLIGSNPLVNLALTKFGKQLQNTENDVNNTE